MTVQEMIDALLVQQKKSTRQVVVVIERGDGTLSREREVYDVRFNGARVVIEGKY